MVINPSDDSYMRYSKFLKYWYTYYGNETAIRADGWVDLLWNKEDRAGLVFPLGTLDVSAVDRAVLRLYVTDPSARGGDVYPIATDWNEEMSGRFDDSLAAMLTTQPVASIGAVTRYTWIEVDVTAALQAHAADGRIGFGIVSTVADEVQYASKEYAGPYAPELQIWGPEPRDLFTIGDSYVAFAGGNCKVGRFDREPAKANVANPLTQDAVPCELFRNPLWLFDEANLQMWLRVVHFAGYGSMDKALQVDDHGLEWVQVHPSGISGSTARAWAASTEAEPAERECHGDADWVHAYDCPALFQILLDQVGSSDSPIVWLQLGGNDLFKQLTPPADYDYPSGDNWSGFFDEYETHIRYLVDQMNAVSNGSVTILLPSYAPLPEADVWGGCIEDTFDPVKLLNRDKDWASASTEEKAAAVENLNVLTGLLADRMASVAEDYPGVAHYVDMRQYPAVYTASDCVHPTMESLDGFADGVFGEVFPS